MILVDANLLLYAYNASSRQHDRARLWLEKVFSSPNPVGLAWATILAFLRITSNANAFETPLTISTAAGIVEQWLSLPMVSIVAPGERHWDILNRLLVKEQIRGPLVMDAHLAALAIEHGLTLCTTDRDFTRFEGLHFENPLS